MNRATQQLLKASECGDESIIRQVLQKQALGEQELDFNGKNSWGNTALMEISLRGDVKILALVLDKRSLNSNIQDAHGWTSLMKAAAGGRCGIIKSLRKYHVPLNFGLKNKLGQTALAIAASYGHRNCVYEILQGSCAEVNEVDQCGDTPFMVAIQAMVAVQGLSDTIEESRASSPILHAAVNVPIIDYMQVIQFLLQAGADVMIRNYQNRMFIDYLAGRALAKVKVLVRKHMDAVDSEVRVYLPKEAVLACIKEYLVGDMTFH